MLATRGRSCTEPRDRIFGLLSIAQGMDNSLKVAPLLKADCTLLTTSVYIMFSKHCITNYGLTFFLSLIKSSPSSAIAAERLPSWSADWTVEWPNVKTIGVREYPAGSRNAYLRDGVALFGAPKGYEILTVVRPRILRGYSTRGGQMDGKSAWKVEDVGELKEGEVVVEIFRGVVMLLRRTTVQEEFVFVRVCPHTLKKEGMF